jgi:hypothetical protein
VAGAHRAAVAELTRGCGWSCSEFLSSRPVVFNMPAKSTEHVNNDENSATDIVLSASRKARSG